MILNTVCKKCKHLITEDPHDCPSSEYLAAKQSLMQGAVEATEEFTEDELEQFVSESQK